MKPAIAIPATAALVYRAYSRKSLTPLGIVFAALTALVHAAHPSAAPFAFLVVFFLAGTAVTKVKHDVKAGLTISAMGGRSSGGGAVGGDGAGGEGPRTHVQVLANSVVASGLVLVDLWRRTRAGEHGDGDGCFAYGDGSGLVLAGITANYAAVAADTFSSELGILAKGAPRLITSPTLREVPRGTNGGVTLLGLGAGTIGALIIAVTSIILLPFCSPGMRAGVVGDDHLWSWERKLYWVLAVTAWGTLGSILDSILGGLLQATVVDKRTGKVVEGSGGRKVLVRSGSMTSTGSSDGNIRRGSNLHTTEDIANALTPRRSRTEYDPLSSERKVDKKDADSNADGDSRQVGAGHDILDNNQINLLMATIMSIGAIGAVSHVWNVSVF